VALEKSKCIGHRYTKASVAYAQLFAKKKEKQKIEKAEKEKVAALPVFSATHMTV